jgi:hypothetical protein
MPAMRPDLRITPCACMHARPTGRVLARRTSGRSAGSRIRDRRARASDQRRHRRGRGYRCADQARALDRRAAPKGEMAAAFCDRASTASEHRTCACHTSRAVGRPHDGIFRTAYRGCRDRSRDARLVTRGACGHADRPPPIALAQVKDHPIDRCYLQRSKLIEVRNAACNGLTSASREST